MALIQYFVTDFTYLIRYPSLPDDCSQIFIRPLNRLLQEGKPVLPDAPLSGVLLASFFTNVPIYWLSKELTAFCPRLNYLRKIIE